MPDHNVLQGSPSVVAGVSEQLQEKANFQAMAHDFIPQPVIGARYYVLRVVLHAWPDETCVEILKLIRAAMRKGCSKVLVYDKVMPEMDCQPFDAMVDLVMWINCGRERTEREQRKVFKKADLRVPGIVRPKIEDRCIIEGVRDDEDA